MWNHRGWWAPTWWPRLRRRLTALRGGRRTAAAARPLQRQAEEGGVELRLLTRPSEGLGEPVGAAYKQQQQQQPAQRLRRLERRGGGRGSRAAEASVDHLRLRMADLIALADDPLADSTVPGEERRPLRRDDSSSSGGTVDYDIQPHLRPVVAVVEEHPQ